MSHHTVRAIMAATAAFVLSSVLATFAPISASADGQIVVTRPDGSAPGKLFTDLTFVPGDTKTEKLVVSQTTEADVTTGIRFESTSPHGPLHHSAEVTISGFGDSVSSPLGEALDTESPFWLGTLSPSDKESITISVRLPESAGNDTKREQARFRVIVTAQGDGVGPTPPPKDSTADSDDSASSSADVSGSDQDDDSSADGGSEATATSDSKANADESTEADGGSGSGADSDAGSGSSSDADGTDRGESDTAADTNADSDSDADGSLPRTGLGSVSVLLVGAGLLLLGVLAVSIVRWRRGRTAS
ncbi:LPXTG cell wall anchor domain-containing protein [Brevibacterium sp. JSBI002]|uniref:LPXTG cell wall anchor domain-containing protein n=1 Tax=Brevibacterium sp. JSBI002 TaxID=2886045 RepID=UPI00222F2C36|nr:LPXTG cell wall anchor domain-containing protein [Brevibacterium sp. JSBI002]UZD62182.1 LPXTG cell wall anchor domain-containing protein [Brevibacterium sp. JSBI002]